MSPTTRVAIVGAGLAGLMCARVLQQHGISATVFEADAHRAARRQGGSLDIHADSGQIALEAGGLLNAFRAKTHPGAEAFRLLDKAGRVFIDTPDTGDGERPEIERGALRDLLIDSLTPGTIRWGTKVTGVRETADGPQLDLADGESAVADVIIGADEAWSRVRRLLTDVTPAYTGITMAELHLDDAGTRHPEALHLIGEGSFFALSDDRSIGGHGGDDIWLGLGLRVPEQWRTTIDWTDAETAKTALLQQYEGWAEPLLDLIRAADGPIGVRPIAALPIGDRWTTHPAITLVGDAAHLMSPFAGEGANLALTDGAELALALIQHTDTAQAITRYEEAMLPRAEQSARASAAGLDLMFSPTAPTEMADFFNQMAPQES